MMTEQEHNNVQWKKVKLGDVCAPSSEKYNPLTENDFSSCIEMENINQESGTINGKSDITKLLSLKNKFHKGEVLYGKLRPYLRKYWLSDCEGACSTEIWVLKSAEGIDNQFLFYLFQSDFINKIANLSSGTKMPRADWAFMKNQQLFIPFKNNKPDLSAQRRIAAILSSADKVIAATQKTIAKYKQMKQGMMEDLLKPKDGWKMVKLGEVGEIVTGSTPTTTKAEYWDGEYNFYSPVDFGENVYCTKTDRTITAAGMKTGRPVPANSIMVACIASIGKIAINRTEGITNQQINTIIPNDDYNFIFLYYLLSLNVEKIKGKAAQTTIPIINKEDFSNLEFSVPVLAEQRRIAAILSGIDAKIAAEEKVLEKYEKVKKGLMEKLLNE